MALDQCKDSGFLSAESLIFDFTLNIWERELHIIIQSQS
jgi:hypothetical protein